jgi:hypothetical protein
VCFNFGGAPSQSDTGGQSPRELNRSVYRVSPVLPQPQAVQRIAGQLSLFPDDVIDWDIMNFYQESAPDNLSAVKLKNL